jgi:hypothetical protein
MEHEPRLPLSDSENAAEDAVSEDKALSIFEDEEPIEPLAERYEDVDLDPVAADHRVSVEEEEEEVPVAGPVGLITGYDPAALSPLDRARSAVWPLVLALTVGLAMGFAGGYGVGSHDRTQGASSAGREFTENAVADAPKKDADTARALERAEAPAATDTRRKRVARRFGRPRPLPRDESGHDACRGNRRRPAPSATAAGRLLIVPRPGRVGLGRRTRLRQDAGNCS